MLAISNRPSHFKEPLPLYTKVMKLVNYNDFREFGDQCGFTFPPIHVFWGASPQNQTKFYLCVLELQNELVDRFRCKEPHLRVGEWRSILKDMYWKWDVMPKLEDKYQPNIDPEYNPENPYVHGSELFFGSVHEDIRSGARTAKVLMDCGCEATADMANEDDHHYSVCHWLQCLHFHTEFLLMDDEFRRLLTPEEQAKREEAIGFLMKQMTCGHPEHAHPWESPDIQCRHPWLLAFRDIMKDWAGFVNYTPSSTTDCFDFLTADLLTVSEDRYRVMELAVLLFWVQFGFTNFGVFPPYFLPSPDQPAFLCHQHS